MKAIQYFSEDYLKQSSTASTQQILEFLEQFRLMQALPLKTASRSKMISLKIDETLLKLFRAKCEIQGVKYQTQIKKLMLSWIE